ncbi:MAG TPA: YkvA family protein [Terriglobales bacterium]|nr:YkvA family protein [Terriglobales bacterium]
MSLNYIRIFRLMKGLLRESQNYRSDDTRSRQLAEEALAKAEKNKGKLNKVWADISAMIRLIKAWAKGNYREIPWRSVSLAIAALLYLISPLDGMPDFIPALGLIDDVFVISWVMRGIQKDLEKFILWEQSAA